MQRQARIHLTALGFVLVVVGTAFGALISRVGMPSGDHVDFYLRVQQYDAELRAGHWPQLLPDAIRGGGHAFPRFYPPLAHLAAVAVYQITHDVVLASHLAMFAGVLLSAMTMYVLLVALTGGALPAVLGSLLYCVTPYRATQILVRGAFAEGWAMVWYPLIMLGLWKWDRDGRFPAWWPAAVAASILSHTASSLWALPVLGIVALLAAARLPSATAWRNLFFSCACSLGLAALSLLPVAWYLSGVRAGSRDLMAATPQSIGDAAALWRHAGAMIVAESIIAVGAAALIRRGRLEQNGSVARLIGYSLLAQVMLVAMSSAPAGIWALVPQPWRYVQFGWRLVGPAAFLAALGLGLLVTRFTSRAGRITALGAAGLLTVSGVFQLRAGGIHDSSLVHASIIPWIRQPYGDLGLTLRGDYLPRESSPETLGPMIEHSRDSLLAAGSLRTDAEGRLLTVRVAPGSIRDVPLPLVAYDTYRVVDQEGVPLPVHSVGGQLVATTSPPVREIRIVRRLPPIVLLGMIVSGVTLVIVLLDGTRSTRLRTG